MDELKEFYDYIFTLDPDKKLEDHFTIEIVEENTFSYIAVTFLLHGKFKKELFTEIQKRYNKYFFGMEGEEEKTLTKRSISYEYDGIVSEIKIRDDEKALLAVTSFLLKDRLPYEKITELREKLSWISHKFGCLTFSTQKASEDFYKNLVDCYFKN